MGEKSDDRCWWKHGVIYHIYVRSFFDSNGDGIGDLGGLTQKLDYLQELGVDGIWLSPIYKSPMLDFGYDITDYRNIDPTFGTFEDFKELINAAHERGIRIIMDMVMNHTSIEHPWFQASKSAETHPKRDWYIWKKGRKGAPPNNWKSTFGGSAWEWDEQTRQYYLHSFLKEQPDLNWRNKAMAKAFFQEIRFWLDLGVDGFRLDVINLIGKDKKFRNNPGILSFMNIQKHLFTRNRGRSYKIVRKLRALIDSYEDKMLVGEILANPPGSSTLAASYLGDGRDMLNMAFDFSLIFRRWNASSYFRTIQKWHKVIPKKGWPCHVLSNHDLYRSINRLGIGNNRFKKAKVAAVMLMTLRGTPFIYYGEEIGMENIKVARKDIKDPLGKKYWPLFSGRDRARSPMQWNTSENGGFSAAKPWLPVSKNYASVNVEQQQGQKDSLLNLYKKLIQLRKEQPELQRGKWIADIKGTNHTISYLRKYRGSQVLVILNFNNQDKSTPLPAGTWHMLLSTHDHRVNVPLITKLHLQPFEAIILKRH